MEHPRRFQENLIFSHQEHFLCLQIRICRIFTAKKGNTNGRACAHTPHAQATSLTSQNFLILFISIFRKGRSNVDMPYKGGLRQKSITPLFSAKQHRFSLSNPTHSILISQQTWVLSFIHLFVHACAATMLCEHKYSASILSQSSSGQQETWDAQSRPPYINFDTSAKLVMEAYNVFGWDILEIMQLSTDTKVSMIFASAAICPQYTQRCEMGPAFNNDRQQGQQIRPSGF